MEQEIHSFLDFCNGITRAGFSMGGGKDEGIYSVLPFSWDNSAPYETKVRWHTGDPEFDPWEWRMRVLEEREDIAYAKLFFGKSGYISAQWYPCFLAVRRGGSDFAQRYADGKVSRSAKRIYELFAQQEVLAVEEIKRLAGFAKEEKSQFDRALTELQAGLFLTMCGRFHRHNKQGEPYGWASTSFCTVEQFFPPELFCAAAALSAQEAAQRITQQIYLLNPKADAKKIQKFIGYSSGM